MAKTFWRRPLCTKPFLRGSACASQRPEPPLFPAATTARSYDNAALTISATVNENRCVVYAVVLPNPSTAPTAADVFAAKGPSVREKERLNRKSKERKAFQSHSSTPYMQCL